AVFLFQWGDEHGNPYPLSMEIVEQVKRHDRGNRYGGVENPDVQNEKVKTQRRKEGAELFEAVAEYYKGRGDDRKRQPLPRSRSLQLSRWRQRRGRNPLV